MNHTNLADFIIVGAAKAGTSSLFEILRRHPDIFIPQRKECRYFSCMSGNFTGPGAIDKNKTIQSPEEYQGLFKKAEPGQLRGDISPDYLYFYQNAVPKMLDEMNAQVPIIIVLRNPIDRAYSHYLQKIRNGWENLSFEAALDAEAERRAANWSWGWRYVDVGLYAQQVKAYLDSFERVLLLLFEEDVVTGQAVGKILKFLNLEPDSGGDPDIHANTSGYPKSQLLHRVVLRMMRDEVIVRKIKNVVKLTPFYDDLRRGSRKILEVNLKKEAMAPQTRQMLREKFQDDVALLAKYTKLPVYEYWTDFQ